MTATEEGQARQCPSNQEVRDGDGAKEGACKKSVWRRAGNVYNDKFAKARGRRWQCGAVKEDEW